ncbi:unnamed protein product [Citrullus colocynthis]|uniref:Uncharacterized protein n=1 Tax=Citrullus colocynthis TaxID=252529 RepID=A0ABP0YP31_9ROSI
MWSIVLMDAACSEGIHKVRFEGIIGSTMGFIFAAVHGFKEVSLSPVCTEVLAILKEHAIQPLNFVV